jgi:hypothetical protein
LIRLRHPREFAKLSDHSPSGVPQRDLFHEPGCPSPPGSFWHSGSSGDRDVHDDARQPGDRPHAVRNFADHADDDVCPIPMSGGLRSRREARADYEEGRKWMLGYAVQFKVKLPLIPIYVKETARRALALKASVQNTGNNRKDAGRLGSRFHPLAQPHRALLCKSSTTWAIRKDTAQAWSQHNASRLSTSLLNSVPTVLHHIPDSLFVRTCPVMTCQGVFQSVFFQKFSLYSSQSLATNDPQRCMHEFLKHKSLFSRS